MTSHNMLSLILDSWFKILWLVSLLIGQRQGVSIVEDYDEQSLFPMLLKCHHVLHPMAKFEFMVDELNVENFNINIFEMILSKPKSSQIGNCRCSKGTKSMQRTLNVLWNDGEYMNPLFSTFFFFSFVRFSTILNWNWKECFV